MNEILQGSALEVLKTLPAESISCCISSPPYWALRDYGVNGQLGLEKTFEEYIEMANKRVMQGERGIPVKEQRQGQGALFPK